MVEVLVPPKKGNFCIIPARGGSKRIPRKNIKEFCGKPILAYSVQTALLTGLFEEVLVSTDDSEIAAVAGKYGASVPFFRSPDASNDHAGLSQVLIEVVEKLELEGAQVQNICCLLPTAPLVGSEQVVHAFSRFIDGGFDSFFPVVAFDYPILRALILKDGKTEMKWPEYLSSRSQDLPTFFHDTGTFYWIKREALFTQKKLFCDLSGSVEFDALVVQDIDTESDWKTAEIKYRLMKSAKQ